MVRSDEPLLSQRRDSSDDSNADLATEDALLTGQRTTSPAPRRRGWGFWRELGLFSWAVLATAAVIILAVVYQKRAGPDHGSRGGASRHPTGKRNLIFMVSDGMGPSSLSLTRSYRQAVHDLPAGDALVLDAHLIGQSRTRSTSSLVTDSAAGATAFSCGLKSYNGAISVRPDHAACGTVLEAAKRAGYMTGLVVTTRITDATPACFAAHVNRRSEEDRIAEQMVGTAHPLGRVVDLMLGGGRCHFLPNDTAHSCRADATDVVRAAREEQGFTYIDSREEFDKLKGGKAVTLPLLGLFARKDIPFEVDRRDQDDRYPSLDEMARTALRALSEATLDSDQGFFLMVEGSRIDHAGHANDPVAQVHEVLAYDRAVASVLDFLDKDDVPGVMVSTSDHETGGLAVARQLHSTYPEYLWFPGVLANASRSAERLAHDYHKFLRAHHDPPTKKLRHFLADQVVEGLGIHDARDDELDALADDPRHAAYAFADMVSRRAQTGWSTHGHSAADVNIYASSPDAARALVGNHENTEVGAFLADYLDLDLDAVTHALHEKGAALDAAGAGTGVADAVGWMGAVPEEDERLDGQDHLSRYQGDVRRALEGRCEVCGH